MRTAQKSQRILSIVAVLVIVAAMLVIPVSADEGMVFTVSPQLPDNQSVPGLGYFYLDVAPGAEQTLVIQADNFSDKAITLEVGVANASTSPSGSMEFTAILPADEAMAQEFEKIATAQDNRVEIPANSQGLVYIDIKLPSEAFDGVVVGGIRMTDITNRLKREAAEKDESAEELGIKVFNEYEHVIGVVLQENDKVIDPNFELASVEIGLSNYEAAIITKIRNSQPLIVKDARYSGAIYPKDSDSEIFSIDSTKVEFAPNSVMSYEFVDKAGYGLKAGDYTFKGKIVYNGKDWNFEDDFTIQKEEVDVVNEGANNQQAVQKAAGIPAWAMVIGILMLILLIALIILLINMNKKRKDFYV